MTPREKVLLMTDAAQDLPSLQREVHTLWAEVAAGRAAHTHRADHFRAHLHGHAAAQQQVARNVHQVGRRRVLLGAFHHGQRGVLGRCRGVGLEAAGFQRVRAGVVGPLHRAHGACTVHHGGGHGVAAGRAGRDGGARDLVGQLQRHVAFGSHGLGLGGRGGDEGQGECESDFAHGVLRGSRFDQP